MLYLAAANDAGAAFWPADLRARADVDRWLDWQGTTLAPSMVPVFWGLVRTAPADRDWAAIHASAARLGTLYGMLDDRLDGQDYLTGPAFTLCDIAIGVQAHRWFSLEEIDKPDLPRLAAWYDRLRARPAFARHVGAKPR